MTDVAAKTSQILFYVELLAEFGTDFSESRWVTEAIESSKIEDKNRVVKILHTIFANHA